MGGQLAVGARPAAACTRKVEPNRLALAGPATWGALGPVRLVGLRWCLCCAQTADLTLLCFAGACLCLCLVPVVGCLCLCLCSDETWGRERQAVGALSTLARMTGKREPEMQSECRRRNAALQRQMADRCSSAWFLSTLGDPGPAACLRARDRKPFSHTQKGPLARLYETTASPQRCLRPCVSVACDPSREG